jgi:uncharacterized membrane protein (DUF485 family)
LCVRDPEYQISGAPQQQCSAHCKYPHRFMDREEFGRVVSHIRKMSLRFAIFMESFAARPPHLPDWAVGRTAAFGGVRSFAIPLVMLTIAATFTIATVYIPQ